MKKFNKIMSLILALAMVLSMCPVMNLTAFAADGVTFSLEQSEITAYPGGSFTLAVDASDLGSTYGIDAYIYYDMSALTLTNATMGADAAGVAYLQPDTSYMFVCLEASGDAFADTVGKSGQLVLLTFAVNDGAAEGTYAVSFDYDYYMDGRGIKGNDMSANVTVAAAAEEETPEESDTSAATVTIGSTTAKAGDTVKVAVSLEHDIENLISFDFVLDYDTTSLQLTGWDKGSAIPGSEYFITKTSSYISVTDNGEESFIPSGEVAVLTFKVLDTAVAGDYAISMSGGVAGSGYDTAPYFGTVDLDTYDYYYSEVMPTINTGKITVEADAPVTYAVTVSETANGTVTADVTEAAEGATVTLTVSPDEGYKLETLTVTDAEGNEVTVADNAFTMPASSVTVSATFTDGLLHGGENLTEGGEYRLAADATGVITIATTEAVTIIGNGAAWDDSYAMTSTANSSLSLDCTVAGVNLTIQDIYATISSSASLIDFMGTGNKLTISGTNLLENENASFANSVIHVPAEGELTIDGEGTLYIYKSAGGTAIGGDSGETNGHIIINGGTIFAKGSKTGAVIGAGQNTIGGAITINGGNLYVMGKARGACLGGGGYSGGVVGTGGAVTINGGSVMLVVDNTGASIGGGGGQNSAEEQDGGTVIINGGSLKCRINSNAYTSWGLDAAVDANDIYRINDVTITAEKLNGKNEAVYVLALPLDGVSANASGDKYVVTVDGAAFYSGDGYSNTYYLSNTTTVSNWPEGDPENSLYLYLTGKDHTVSVNGTETTYYWDAENETFSTEKSHEHNYGSVTTEATCTEDGVITYTCECGDTYTETIPANGHAYPVDENGEAKIEFAWSFVDYSSYAYYTCTNCGEQVTIDVTVTSETTEASCEVDGQTVYTAACELDGVEYSTTVIKTIKATGHTYENGSCTVCGEADPTRYAWYEAGAETGSYTISTAEELAQFAAIVNGTDENYDLNSFAGETVTLGADIDLSAVCGAEVGSWEPIGGATENVPLTLDSQEALDAALETYILIYDTDGVSYKKGASADKQKAWSADASYYYISGKIFSGIFDGNGKTISNLYVNVSTGYAGLFGNVGGILKNFTINGSVTSTASNLDFVGGVAGKLSMGGIIERVNSYVDVTAKSCYNVGGVVGCVGSKGSFESADNTFVLECANYGAVSGYQAVGGIAGHNAGQIQRCFNAGSVEALKSGSKSGAGGIVGRNGENNTASDKGTVIDCYNKGAVKGSKWVGGITGFNPAYSSVLNCYNLGTCSGSGQTNPIVGQNEAKATNGAIVSNCWYLDTTKGYDATGVYGGNQADCGAKTAEELKTVAFLNLIGTVYVSDSNNINNGYPVLYWQNGLKLYSISVDSALDPNYIVASTQAANGSTIMVTLANGYVDGSLKYVADGVETAITVTDGVGSFEMPASNVTLTAEFGEPTFKFVTTGAFVSEIYESAWFNIGDFVITAVDKESGETLATITEYTVTLDGEEIATNSTFKFSADDAGKTLAVNVIYQGISGSFAETVKIIPDIPLEISYVSGAPAANTMIYNVGEVIDLGSMYVQVKLASGNMRYTVMTTSEPPIYANLSEALTSEDNGKILQVCYTMNEVTVTKDLGTITVIDTVPQDENGVYQISNAQQLQWFAAHVDRGNVTANAILTADINLSGLTAETWNPIGSTSAKYAGTFDGNGKTIIFNITEGITYTALFHIIEGGTVQNLTVDGMISTSGQAAAITLNAYSNVTIQNCVNKANITSTSNAAAFVVSSSYDTASIINCVNYGTITSTGSNVGGIAASFRGTVSGCVNYGAITGKYSVGGIVGENSGTIEYSYNIGAVTASGSTSSTYGVGGIVGTEAYAKTNTLISVYNTGKVSLSDETMSTKVGAVVGYTKQNMTIAGAYALEGAAEVTYNAASGKTLSTEPEFKTDTELRADEMAVTLGEKFKSVNACSYPILTWQDDSAANTVHSFNEDGFCAGCGVYNPDADAYTVRTAANLKAIADGVNAGDTMQGKTVTLANDIDLSAVCGAEVGSWEPIGGAIEKISLEITSQEHLDELLQTYILIYDTDGVAYKKGAGADKQKPWSADASYYYISGKIFSGTFDGNGKTVSNLYINTDECYLGLFGNVNGTVKNLTLKGAITCTGTQTDYVGSVAGLLSEYGVVERCVSYVTINALDIYNVGGIVGCVGTKGQFDSRDNTFVLECVNFGDVTAYQAVGGIAGHNAGQIQRCANYGTIQAVKSGAKAGAGGIVGRNGENNTASDSGTILDCYNAGTVGLASRKWQGGIVGFNPAESVIKNCYNVGTIVAGQGQTNALVGQNEGYVENSWCLDTTIVQDSNGVYDAGGSSVNCGALTEEEMKAPVFAATLGENYNVDDGNSLIGSANGYNAEDEAPAGYPVLAWMGGTKAPALYTVTLPDSDETFVISTADSTTVAEGGSFSFKVYIESGYTINYVKANDTELTADGSTYTIENITSDVTVTVSVSKKVSYTVTLPENGEGYTIDAITESTTVEEGSEFQFTVTADDGYQIDSVKAGDTELTADENGVYTITVTGNVEITVTASEKVPVPHSVTVVAVEGGSVTADVSEAMAGDFVSLTVTADDDTTLMSLTVTDADGKQVEVFEDNTFVMPDSEVTVTPDFLLHGGEILTAGGYYKLATDATGQFTIATAEKVTISGHGAQWDEDINGSYGAVTSPANEDIEIICTEPGVTLILKDVYLSNSFVEHNLIDFTGTGNTLIFDGTVVLDHDCNAQGYASIHVPSDASLHIYGTPGSRAYLYKREQAAGIGGNYYEAGGEITFGIEGGANDFYFFMKGSKQGAVIGNGANCDDVPGNITFNSGIYNFLGVARGAIISGSAGAASLGAGNVFVNGGLLNFNVDYSGAAIGGGGYASGNDKDGGLLYVDGGSIRVYIDSNAADNGMWSAYGVTEAGVNDVAITAGRVNADGSKDVYQMVVDTSDMTASTYSIAVDGATYYSGPRYGYCYYLENTNRDTDGDGQADLTTAPNGTPGNWIPLDEPCFYLYVTGENHIVTVNGTPARYVWDEATKTFTVEKLYTVTLPEDGEGYTIDAITESTIVEEGGEFQFTVTADAGYQINSVKAGDTELTADENGVYTIENITSNVEVVVSAEKITYTVTLPENGEGYTVKAVTESTTVEEGGEFQFTVTADAGYQINSVKAGDTELTADENGVYTIENITSNVEVVVSAEKITYTVTLPENGEGYTVKAVTESTTVEEGGEFQFTVTADTGYQINSVKAGDTELTADENGVYTIENITSNVEVVVSAEKITYTVTLPEDGEGYTVKAVTESTTVEEGGEFQFTVTAAEDYEIESVKNGDAVLTADENGVYTITVTENVTIEVTAKAIEYDVALGDVNLDGKVDQSDVALLFAYVMEEETLSKQQLLNGDVNADGADDSSDVTKLLSYVLGQIASLQ